MPGTLVVPSACSTFSPGLVSGGSSVSVAWQPPIATAAARNSRQCMRRTPLFLAGGPCPASHGHTRPVQLVAIFGPTGVGKTAVAVALAERLRDRGENPLAI